MELQKEILPNRESFGADPFGYSSSAWITLGAGSDTGGFPCRYFKTTNNRGFKKPDTMVDPSRGNVASCVYGNQSRTKFRFYAHLCEGGV